MKAKIRLIHSLNQDIMSTLQDIQIKQESREGVIFDTHRIRRLDQERDRSISMAKEKSLLIYEIMMGDPEIYAMLDAETLCDKP